MLSCVCVCVRVCVCVVRVSVSASVCLFLGPGGDFFKKAITEFVDIRESSYLLS